MPLKGRALQVVDDATIAKNAARILERVSPSQVETFEMCPRRWYNDSMRGLREGIDPDGAAQRGIDVAGASDLHYRTGIDVDAIGMLPSERNEPQRRFVHHELLKAILPHLPPRGPTVSTEEWVESELGHGLPKLRGRYDLFDSALLPRKEGAAPTPLLGDIKCRSDARYTKTPAELANDLQLNAYARPLALKLGAPSIALRHAYGITKKKPKGFPVTVILDVAELQPRFDRTVESVREMTRWAKERPSTADPLPPNPAACDKYRPHGCPHRALCGFDGSSFNATRSPTKMSTDTSNGAPQSDLMKRLAARTAELTAKRGGAPAPAHAHSPAKQEAAPEPEVKAAAAPQGGFCSKCGAGLTQENVSRLKDGNIVHAGCPGLEAAGPAVVPPDAPSRTNEPSSGSTWERGETTREQVAAAVEQAAEKPKRTRKPKESPAQTALPSAPTPEEAERAQIDEEIAEQERRAKPSNIRFEGRLLTVGEVEDAGKEQPEVATAIERIGDVQSIRVETVTQKVIPTGPIVYVNCIPTKGEHKGSGVMFEEWLAPICEELCQEKGVVDYRLIQYTAKGDLAAKVRKYISTCPPVVLVSKFSPSADVFLESVIPWASQIIQGV